MTAARIRRFIVLAQHTKLSYNEVDKERFHKEGIAVLRELAKALGLSKGGYDLWSNMGGIAVSGEVTLHTPSLYVQFAQLGFANSYLADSFLWRTCNGRKDYSGGPNQWAKWEELLDMPALARKMQSLT